MIKEQLSKIILTALDQARDEGVLPAFSVPVVTLEKPKGKAFGDWSTNVALALASSIKGNPRQIAEQIVKRLPIGRSVIDSAEIAGPGFINMTLNSSWLHEVLHAIKDEDETYGHSRINSGKSVLLEFVSANPNGPITVAHGRNAAIGDAIYRLLEATGYSVQREHYTNDALNSTQMNNFGKSVFCRYLQAVTGKVDPSVEDYDWLYRGDYVLDIAKSIAQKYGDEYVSGSVDDPELVHNFREFAQDGMIAEQRSDLLAFGVTFDSWFNESTLHNDGRVQSAVADLTARGHTYEKDGALWFRTTTFGDDKDRVLFRANGTATYLAGDVAYHKDKFERGFDLIIDIWGADHAGYVSRTKASALALGYDAAKLEVMLYQLVRILKNGEFVKSSKRRGDVLYLKADLIDEIGKDAARFYFLMRSPNTDLDIDLDLAKKTEKENPVYYVQYAHARIVQSLEKARELPCEGTADLSQLSDETEIDLIKKLSDFPDEVLGAAQDRAPQKLIQYARELASQFHSFYDTGNRDPELRVACEDMNKRLARVELVDATRIVLRNALSLLGISSPDRM